MTFHLMFYSKQIESERYFLISETSGSTGLELGTFAPGKC